MRTGQVAAVFAQGALWRATGARMAGNALARAFASDDEMVRVLAGMLLVKGGRRAGPVIREALAKGRSDPDLIAALADVGTVEDEALLRGYAQSPDPEVARAATEALEALGLAVSPEARATG
jgi:hypothetical protein